MAVVENYYWPDSELDGLALDYDSVRISFRMSDGKRVQLLCSGYIALEIWPFWDEAVITSLTVQAPSTYASEALAALDKSGANRLPSGSPARNTSVFGTLLVQLSDGGRIRVAAGSFKVEG
jgi:hypothetical protein